MKGKTVVITGGTSGIGEVAAEALAQMGARIILVARSRSRADATLTRLRESGPNVTHSVYFADLARLAEMKRVAAEIAMREPPIDVLINNAGALFGTRRLGRWARIYLGAQSHVLFCCDGGIARATLGLRSGTHHQYSLGSASGRHAGFRRSSIGEEGAVRAYGRSKLCNVLFTRELARRLHGTQLTANCLHPGFVATRFADESGGLISRMAWLAKYFAITPAEGAQTIIYLASSPEVANVTGKYFYKCHPTTPSPPALDDRAALALWQRSAALAGMKE
jgi:NAD(P)-dependent dehydrogenase (short-subunit alcohol dehydrogenase family)